MSEMNTESCFKNMYFRDRGCVRTLRPLFVYATDDRAKTVAMKYYLLRCRIQCLWCLLIR